MKSCHQNLLFSTNIVKISLKRCRILITINHRPDRLYIRVLNMYTHAVWKCCSVSRGTRAQCRIDYNASETMEQTDRTLRSIAR